MSKQWTTATCVAVGLMGWSVLVATPAAGNTIVVTNTSEYDAGSLRDAIAIAAPGDTIQVNVSGVISLIGGPLVVRKNLSIVGPGAASLTVSGNGSILAVAPNTCASSTSGPGPRASTDASISGAHRTRCSRARRRCPSSAW